MVLVAAFAAVAAAAAAGAIAAPWCGTTTTEDRPPAITGRSIRVVYAYPSDAPDRSAERAPLISADVDEVAAWWRTQDPDREPRFDRASFACGLQVDLLVVPLSDSAAAVRADPFNRIVSGVFVATGQSLYEKHVVYYDGPVDHAETCGQGGGTAEGEGIAVVFLAACSGVPTAVVAAHELIHALGALPDRGPPNACPDTRVHPCDSASDILYPEASGAPLSSLVLDVGHDDYYGHSGSWLDVQDSRWLWLVTQQVSLQATIVGKGSVESDVPGIDCAASCVTQWDAGSAVELEAHAAQDQRFVRWSGSCSGTGRCAVSLASAQTVTALFAPERFRLVINVSGKGSVTGAGAICRTARCERAVTSYASVRLRAAPSAGWRFAGWSVGCGGTSATCTLPMAKATSVRARFVRR